jgi:branched-chain amino acid transport system substrate-binding protein
VRRAIALSIACVLAAALAGCGGGEGGAANGATVSAYVTAPLCASAKRELAHSGGRAGKVRVRAICLPNPVQAGKLSLAATGANARRATEDSTTVGYLEPRGPAAARFTHPILESAGIPSIPSSSGKTAMARLLQAIEESGSGSRASVRAALSKT